MNTRKISIILGTIFITCLWIFLPNALADFNIQQTDSDQSRKVEGGGGAQGQQLQQLRGMQPMNQPMQGGPGANPAAAVDMFMKIDMIKGEAVGGSGQPGMNPQSLVGAQVDYYAPRPMDDAAKASIQQQFGKPNMMDLIGPNSIKGNVPTDQASPNDIIPPYAGQGAPSAPGAEQGIIVVNGQPLGQLGGDGIIIQGGKTVGKVDEHGIIIITGKPVGQLNEQGIIIQNGKPVGQMSEKGIILQQGGPSAPGAQGETQGILIGLNQPGQEGGGQQPQQTQEQQQQL